MHFVRTHITVENRIKENKEVPTVPSGIKVKMKHTHTHTTQMQGS